MKTYIKISNGRRSAKDVKYVETVGNLDALLFSMTRLGSHVSDRLPVSRRFLIDSIAAWVDHHDLRAVVATALG